MQKIVISTCYGGFGLSDKAAKELGYKDEWDARTIKRDDKKLIEYIEKNGSKKASGKFAELKIVKIPDGVKWTIEEYDGREWIAEDHRTWE